ncbi:MAG: hypothetical protein AW07_04242 [Candidatus Accumulibacter sp. SK-11]|nr:MAG: hypothetical protein AW07_04242 [Candidatus Accumulibacter sp. SK-11]
MLPGQPLNSRAAGGSIRQTVGRRPPGVAPLTAMTVATPPIMKATTVSLIPGPSPAHGKRAILESLTRLSH